MFHLSCIVFQLKVFIDNITLNYIVPLTNMLGTIFVKFTCDRLLGIQNCTNLNKERLIYSI